MTSGKLILRKIIKIVATRCHILLFTAKMHQIRFRLGFCPKPCWGTLQRSLDPLSGSQWPTSSGGEGGKRREGPGGYCRRGRGGMLMRWGNNYSKISNLFSSCVPGLVASYNIRPGNRDSLFLVSALQKSVTKTVTHILTAPDPHESYTTVTMDSESLSRSLYLWGSVWTSWLEHIS